MFDLSTNTEKQITTNTADQFDPSISGNRIVYYDGRNGNSNIYMYDISINAEKQITTNGGFFLRSQVTELSGRMIETATLSIYMYEISTNTEKRDSNQYSKSRVRFYDGTRIVWVDYRNGYDNGDIYMYDLSTNTEKGITTNTADQYDPSISGNRIVWTDCRNGYNCGEFGCDDADIYMYDLSTNTGEADHDQSADQIVSSISGNRIVWADDANRQLGHLHV